jgi:transposase InsO family protein
MPAVAAFPKPRSPPAERGQLPLLGVARDAAKRCGGFTSWSFGKNLRRHNLLESLGTVGNCFDNTVMESTGGRLQTELLNTRKWSTTLELTVAMADYIDNFYNFYNLHRRHSYLGQISPSEYETLWHEVQSSPRLS